MKKLLALELGVLVLVLVAAMIVSFSLAKPVFSPDSMENSDSTTTESTGESTEESTSFVPSWKVYPEDRRLLAQQYFVYDCKTGTFLTTSGHDNQRVYPASITKLFTAYVVMQYLKPEDTVTAGDALDMVAWGSSVAKIKKGDVLTVEQLVEAMMLPSGNDAAYILACEAGRVIKKDDTLTPYWAVKAFMTQMNKEAKNVGMTGTNFVNPDGIHDSNHYSTFQDLAALGKLSMENKTIAKYAVLPKDQVELHGQTVEWKNTNALIDETSEYYCPYAVGLKTGQTPSAGSCLLSAFRMDGYELIIGVFGCPKEEDRFDDTLQLFNQIVLK